MRLNQIAAQARLHGPQFALAALGPLVKDLAGYRWYHAMRGALLQETGDHRAALSAFDAALALEPMAPEEMALQEKINVSRKTFGAV